MHGTRNACNTVQAWADACTARAAGLRCACACALRGMLAARRGRVSTGCQPRATQLDEPPCIELQGRRLGIAASAAEQATAWRQAAQLWRPWPVRVAVVRAAARLAQLIVSFTQDQGQAGQRMGCEGRSAGTAGSVCRSGGGHLAAGGAAARHPGRALAGRQRRACSQGLRWLESSAAPDCRPAGSGRAAQLVRCSPLCTAGHVL